MRKHYKKLILELINTLREANTELKKLYIAKNTSALSTLLSDCQEVAAQIMNTIEQLEGEDTKTCNYIVEYYEMLYRASLECNNNHHIMTSLENQVRKIEKSVNKDIKSDKLEIVFFPYKASMFDSMESIWLAAEDDSQCDAYVVPVPYFEYTANHELGKMCYEGSMFPETIPITSWESYNVEIRRPDAIIIHNPYDEYNIVTCVHPNFHAKRLQNFTDMLVYVPYFIANEESPSSLCVLPGTIYADRVTLVSEEARRMYINAFNKWVENNGITKKHPLWNKVGNLDNKFLAFGSPKFDKAITSREEDYEIPNEWYRLIYNADETKKPVVLYNTRLTDMTAGIDNQLIKLKHALNEFKNQKELTLLWRPHPLNIECLRSMRPQYLNEYKQIVDNYINEAWGIYDDSPDLHRAITLSSAYYGDPSSLVPLFQCAGKPIMIQDFNIIPKNENFNNLSLIDLCDDAENFWFSETNFNALFNINKKELKLKFVGSFMNEQCSSKHLYYSITKINNKLYFSPHMASEIAVYDISKNVFDIINFRPNKKGAHFSSTIPYKNYIFFINVFYPNIIRLDIDRYSVDYFDDFNRYISEEASNDNGYFANVCAQDNFLFMPVCSTNAVIVFDMDKCISNIFYVGDKKSSYNSICYDGKYYWLAPRNQGAIIKWEPFTQNYIEYNNYPSGFNNGQYGFLNMIYLSGYVWLFPYDANMALKIDTNNGEIIIADEFQNECMIEGVNIINYTMAKEMDNATIYAFTGKSNKIIEYNTETKLQREKKLSLSEETIEIMKKDYFKTIPLQKERNNNLNEHIYFENQIIKLKDLFELITIYNEHSIEVLGSQETDKKTYNSCGLKTYEYIKSEVL